MFSFNFFKLLMCQRSLATFAFVPKHRAVKKSDIDCFNYFFENHKKILALTGAGISTESGIPDYRSDEVGLYARNNHKPVQYQEFVKSSYARKRYWARNFVAWPRVSTLEPNTSHLALAKLNLRVVTQNVDGLHTKAGSTEVVELHGSGHRVVCMKCGDMTSRSQIQERLLAANPGAEFKVGALRPDGDIDIHEDQVKLFNLIPCDHCGGDLKPDIVFFGDNVPSTRVKKVASWVEDCDGLLIAGSSLTVFSSFRIIQQAASLKKYVFLVNIGPTRGDHLADIKLEVRCGDLFSNLKLVS